jgi:hypothetical protein
MSTTLIENKNPYQALLRAKIRSAIEEARSAAVFSHQGVKGTVLEILVERIFKPMLPADIGVGTGQIIDCFQTSMSDQVDIILYDKSILPPVLIDEKTGIFPIESVLYAIEVKTTLNSFELAKAHRSAKKLSELKFLSGLQAQDKSSNHPIEPVRSVIFALNSDLKGSSLTEAKRYKKIYNDKSAYIRAICVAGQEYWYDDGEYWAGFNRASNHDETLTFIAGVTNTYKTISKSRLQPLLGHYIAAEVAFVHSTASKKSIRLEVICQSCQRIELFKPDLGTQDITINGAIICSTPCPQCSGTMQSKTGTFIFVRGILQ